MFPSLTLGRFHKLGRTLGRLAALAHLATVMSAQHNADFGEVIKTPATIQAALERCDGDRAFETAFANWLESAQPRSLLERDAIRTTSLRLLEDTTNRQLVLALIDGLLRHAVEDLKSDPSIAPARMARTLYSDIAKAARNGKSRASDIALLADSLLQDGIITNERQTSFIQAVVNLARFPGARPATAKAISTERPISVGP